MIASQEVAIRGPVAAGATLHLNVGSDDAVTVSGANLDVQSAALGDDEGEPYIADLYIRIHRDDGTYESLSYVRSFGRWQLGSERVLFDPNSDSKYTALDGAPSGPFPSGHKITSSGLV